MKDRTKQIAQLVLAGAFGLFVAASFAADYGVGKDMGRTFGATLAEMLKLLPCAFILIALFDVWVKHRPSSGTSVRVRAFVGTSGA